MEDRDPFLDLIKKVRKSEKEGAFTAKKHDFIYAVKYDNSERQKWSKEKWDNYCLELWDDLHDVANKKRDPRCEDLWFRDEEESKESC